MESEISEAALIRTATSLQPSSSLPEETLDHEEEETHPSTSTLQIDQSKVSESPQIYTATCSQFSLADKTLDQEEEETHHSPMQMGSTVSKFSRIYTAPFSPPPLIEKTLDDDEAEEEIQQSLPPPSFPISLPYFPEARPSLFSPFSYYDEEKHTMMGAGLLNLGNTCFLNSILQCFTHTVPLLESLRSYNHETPCLRYLQGFCVICTLREHIDLSLTQSGGVVSPDKFVDNLSNLSSSFRRYDQEDAHEFLQCLLDRLDSCCFDLNKQGCSSSLQEDSFVKKIFGGRLKSQLRCCNCGHCSDTFEPLIDLSLEIEDVDTLPDALKSFTKVEKIEDSETKFTCEKCEREVSLEKQFTLDQAPSVATFHLKRFKNDGYFVEKIDKLVEYPLELDLQPYTNSSEDFDVKLKYELYAVVVHVGFTNSSGHYFCYIRSAPQTWHRLDDSKVVRVREEHVLREEAYILFYAREGTPWFSSFMEAYKPYVCRNSETTSPTSVLHDVYSFGIPPHQEKSKCIGDAEVKDVDVERISHQPCIDRFTEVKEDEDDFDVCPKTPPKSPILDPDDEIYADEPPGVSYDIPRSHLKLKGGSATQRSANKALEDSKRKEAVRLTRSMPSSRANKFRSYILPNSERPTKRKKRKSGMSFDVGTDGQESSPLKAHRRLVEFR